MTGSQNIVEAASETPKYIGKKFMGTCRGDITHGSKQEQMSERGILKLLGYHYFPPSPNILYLRLPLASSFERIYTKPPFENSKFSQTSAFTLIETLY